LWLLILLRQLKDAALMPTQLGSLLVLRDLSNDAFMLAIQIKERFNLKNNIKATFN
jgi:hypothetical protein